MATPEQHNFFRDSGEPNRLWSQCELAILSCLPVALSAATSLGVLALDVSKDFSMVCISSSIHKISWIDAKSDSSIYLLRDSSKSRML